jgi:4-amino-4-deoxy-L-arabinose transferase-like glycosyltransferase
VPPRRLVRARKIPWPLALVAGAAVAGIALRLFTLTSGLRILDADEPVWGLIARHVLDGEFSVFFWGQAYGGTQEAVLTAGVFALTGSGTLTLRIVPIALTAIAAILVWRIGRRTVGEPAAMLGAALFWIYPAYSLWKLTRAHGFYAFGLVCALLVLLLALRLHERPNRVDAAGIGLALGYGWWATPLTALVAVPALAWLLWQRPRVLRLAWVTLPMTALGAAPWLVWNVTNEWRSLDPPEPFRDESFPERLVGFFSTTLPELLGVRVPFPFEWTVGAWFGWALVAAAVAGFTWLLIRRFGGPETPLLLIALSYPILLSLTSISSYRDEPRYLVLLAPVVALLLSKLLARGPAVAAVGLAAAFALTSTDLLERNTGEFYLGTSGGKHIPGDLTPLIEALDEAHVDRAFADYWFTYGISFLSRERVIATPTNHVRYEPHDRLVRASPNPAHLFVSGSTLELAERPRLEREGFRRLERAGFAIYVRR